MHLSALVALAALMGAAVAQPEVPYKSHHFRSPGAGGVRCEHATPLTACRVRVTSFYGPDVHAELSFARGPASAAVALGPSVRARYLGEGLHRGHCGLELVLDRGDDLVALVECFGALGNGTWTRGFGLLAAQRFDVLAVSSTASAAILAAPGSAVGVKFVPDNGLPMGGCYVRTPSAGEVYLSPGHLPPPGSRYRVFGAGAERGECGASVSNVTAADAGLWWWYGTQYEPRLLFSWQVTALLVLEAPEGWPALRVLRPTGDGVLRASCAAPPAVPPARLSWWLDGQLVRRDAGNETDVADLGRTRPWQPQAAFQTFERALRAQDAGLWLECRMEHDALAAGRSVGLRLPRKDSPDGEDDNEVDSDDRQVLEIDARAGGDLDEGGRP